jgi:hypothetical protein
MSPHLSPLHQDLTFLSPLSDVRAERLVRFLADGHPATMLDLGCGWGELLLRTLEAVPEATGTGVDQDEAALGHAREQAAQRGLVERARFESADAGDPSYAADGVICIGSSQIWGPPVEENQPMAYAAALTALRAKLPRGGRLVYGEGIWSRPPTPEATAHLAGRDDELVGLPALLDLAIGSGFAVLGAHEASLDEWDVFETGYTAGYARWLAEHPADDAEAEQVRGLATRQRSAYFAGYRGILGLAYLELLAV